MFSEDFALHRLSVTSATCARLLGKRTARGRAVKVGVARSSGGFGVSLFVCGHCFVVDS